MKIHLKQCLPCFFKETDYERGDSIHDNHTLIHKIFGCIGGATGGSITGTIISIAPLNLSISMLGNKSGDLTEGYIYLALFISVVAITTIAGGIIGYKMCNDDCLRERQVIPGD